MHERRTVCAILCVLLFASFSVVFTSITGTAYAQAPQTITPTITLVSSPCDLDTAPSPCLVATSTSIQFDISFDSITLIRATFETTDVVWVDSNDTGNLHDEYGTFKYRIFVYEDDTVTLRIPAGSVSDTSGNTNSAAEITIRTDHTPPTVQIHLEPVPDGAYRQFVQINQPYVAPTVTCVDEVYDGMVLLRTDRYDVVANKVVTTDVDPDDLPRIITVRYSCQDEAQRTDIEYLKVHLVEDLAVINRSPTVTSIDRYNPSAEDTDSQELVYRVIFSKDVTGVDTRDFDLSLDSTGGRENNPDDIPDPFTETRSPSLAIPYNDTVSDAITVPDSIDATSVSVAVDISHRYVVDLKVDLVAPDGTVMTLHDRTVKHTANLVQTYNPSFADMDAAGNWTLQINDIRPYDTGILRSWTLTVHYGPAFTPTIADVKGYGSEYRVTVPAITSGTYNLDLVSSGHGIVDIIGNALTNTTPTSGRDQTYNVSITDSTAPTLASIERSDPSDERTSASTLVFEVTFSEAVQNVDATDFELSGTGAGSITVSDVSGYTYNATVAVSTDGTFNLDIASGHDIENLAGTGLASVAPTGADRSYTVDRTAPTVTSIARSDPSDEYTSASTLVFEVTFSEAVQNVDATDFELSGSGAGTITVSDVSGYTYNATVAVSTDGTFNLDLVSSGHGIVDIIGNALTNTTPTSGRDQTYNVSITDSTAPTLASIERSDPSDERTSASTLVFEVTFSEAVQNVDATDFELSGTGAGSITVSDVSGYTYNATVAVSTDGTFNLDIASGHDIENLAGTGLASVAPTGADRSYTVDRTAPTVTSIARSDPSDEYTSASTLVFEVTFSEAVQNVDATDFELSGSGAGTITVSDVSGYTYNATVAVSTDGTFNLDLVSSGHGIVDIIGNALTNTTPTSGRDQTYNVSITDSTAPTLASIERSDPSDERTSASTLVFEVTFSEAVQNVDATDFELSGTGAGSITVSDVSGYTYNATVAVSTDGTFNLDIASGHDIENLAGTGLASVAPTGADRSYTVDRTAPTVTSIARSDPSDEYTSASTLVFEVTFSEAVQNVDATDFELSGSGAGTITVSDVSGYTYNATVAVSTDGTFNLDLVSSGHGIVDIIGNALTNTTPTSGRDQTYNVSITDSTAPTLASIERSDPSDERTSASTLVFEVTFSEAVQNVDATDFELSGTGAGSITVSDVSGYTYNATVAVSTDGTFNLDIASGHDIEDLAGTGLASVAPTGADRSYTVDRTAPTVTSIARSDPSDEYTSASTLVFEVTFSEAVQNVDATDFELSGSGAGTITVSDVSGYTYNATVAVSTDGTFNLDIASGHDIEDLAGTGLASVAPTGADRSYTVDRTAPTVTSIARSDPSDEYTSASTLVFEVTFSEAVQNVDATDFELSGSGAGTITVSDVSGYTYNATVAVSTDGTFNLDLVSSGHGIVDTASNPLTNTVPTTGTDQTYTVDTTVVDETAPTLASIQRHEPADQDTDSQTLVYQVTFSENVTGVGMDNFVLSPDSTVAGNSIDTTADPEQFTQTRSPSLAIPYNDTVSDAITVPDSGNATSVSVAIDISHTYIEDLKVDLVAPDGTLVTLHDREGGYNDDIVRTYVPSFDGVSIAGAWTLKINDNYDDDSGTLNSWTLTIDYDPAVIAAPATTAGPVTGVSGSGDTYRVTVFASVDGTYNLDLVSPGHDIKDAAENPLTDTAPTTGTDHTYAVSIAVVDETAPALASIQQHIPETRNTDIQTLVYRVVFSEGVSGVDVDDFALSPGSTGGGDGNNTAGSEQFTQTRSPSLAIPYNDTVSDAITVPDSGNATSVLVAIDISHAYIGDLRVDLVAPDGTLVTLHAREGGYDDDIVRAYAPSFDGVSIAGSWTLKINDNYDDDSGTLNSWKLAINHGTTITTAGPVTGVSGSGDTYHVTVSASTNGTYNLDLVSSGHGIVDAAGNPLNNTAPTTGADYTYTVSIAAEDTTAPALASIQRHSPEAGNTDGRTLVYKVTFSEDMKGVDTADFVLSPNSTGSTATTNPVTYLLGLYSVYYVTVSASANGTYNLDLVSSGHGIEDTAGNPLTDTVPTTGTDQTYAVGGTAVDDTAPALASIQRHSPAAQNTYSQKLVYRAVFSEDVTGVDAADFVLSPGSAGGGSNTATSSEQFTQTHLPSSPITDNSDASDTITIPGSGTVTSVSVSVDISHTYIGDLKVDLVAPDGTVRTLHNRTGGSTDDIVKTYTPDFDDDVQIQGGWKLNIRDNADRDTGTLNSWTLGVNYDTATTTPSVSPVTEISGSGSAYYVTVFASANGTYNLDLVSSGHGIKDAAENPLTNTVPTTGTDHTYTVRGIVVDDTAPELASIQRYIPETQNTSSLTFVYKATFSEDVTGVDLNDFVLSHGSTGGGGNTTTPMVIPVTNVAGYGDVYFVLASAPSDGTYNLDLVSSGHGIEDTAGNPLTDTATETDQTYTVSTDT